jgi:hypothetical protein
MTAMRHLGICHCGAVRFAVALDLAQGASRCNCGLCTKISVTAAFAKPAAFTLLSDAAALGAYGWGGRGARRYFCKICGTHCFARGDLPELGGAYVSVNVNVLEDVDPATVPVRSWDGCHDSWEPAPRATPWPLRGAAAA